MTYNWIDEPELNIFLKFALGERNFISTFGVTVGVRVVETNPLLIVGVIVFYNPLDSDYAILTTQVT